MTKKTTRSLVMLATISGMIGLVGCANDGYSTSEPATPTTSSEAPMTSTGPAAGSATTTAPAPAPAQP